MLGQADSGFVFDSPQFYGYAVVGSLLVVIVCHAVHFASGPATKLPTIVVSTVAGFLSGFAAGMLVMAIFGYHWYPQPAPKLPPGVAPPIQMGQSPGPPRGGPGGIDLTAPAKQPGEKEAGTEAKPESPSEPPQPPTPPQP